MLWVCYCTSVLCGVGIVWLYHRQTPSSFPSSPPACLCQFFVLLFNYIAFQTSSMCPVPLTSLWTLGIALQLNATVAFSNRDLPAASSSPLYLVPLSSSPLNCLTAAFIWYIYANRPSVTKCWLNGSFHHSRLADPLSAGGSEVTVSD